MAAYSMDLRKRVVRAWDGGMDAESVAGLYTAGGADSPTILHWPNPPRTEASAPTVNPGPRAPQWRPPQLSTSARALSN